MITLREIIVQATKEKYIGKLEKMRDEISSLIHLVADRIQEALQNGENVHRQQQNIAQARLNFALIQGGIDSINNGEK